jgi:hypothetical protein
MLFVRGTRNNLTTIPNAFGTGNTFSEKVIVGQ